MLKGEESPSCVSFDEHLSPEHISRVFCASVLSHIRENYFKRRIAESVVQASFFGYHLQRFETDQYFLISYTFLGVKNMHSIGFDFEQFDYMNE